MSHFSDIGFKIEKKEDITKAFLDLKEKSLKREFGDHFEYITQDTSGAELYWITRKPSFFKKEEFVGVTPSFHGQNTQSIKDPKLLPNEEWPLEPSLDLWVYDEDNNEYPLVVDLPNYIEVKERNLSDAKNMQGTLFANSFEYFGSEEKFWEKYPKDKKVSIPAPGMFIPTGTFSPKGDLTFKPHSDCWCYGKIEQIKKLKNSMTGNEFYHFIMTTLAARYDVVVDPTMLEEEPELEGIIGGRFWICAKAIF